MADPAHILGDGCRGCETRRVAKLLREVQDEIERFNPVIAAPAPKGALLMIWIGAAVCKNLSVILAALDAMADEPEVTDADR